jgi:hypothetical protein
MKFQHNDPCYNIESGIENGGLALTRSETRGPKGSGDAADLKLPYTIQFSILMLCAKYQEAGLCGS